MQEKKVVDIFSPQKEEKAFVFKKKPEAIIKKEKAPRPAIKGIVWVFGGGALILVLTFLFLNLATAKIQVWPETEPLSLKTKVTVDKTASLADFKAALIPGQVFEKTKTITEKFPATGTVLKETKAQGTLRVYNEYSTSPQVLVATTRFVSANGRLFRTPTRVTVPGGSYQGGKLVPGETDIEVVADQPGEDYNIGPSTFSIPGFAGTEKYTKFYAKSFDSMAGGQVQEATQVTKEDLGKAESSLDKRAKTESEEALITALEAEKEINYIKKALLTQVVETLSLARAGDKVESFNFQIKAKSEVLIFQKEDLEDFVKDFIVSQIGEGLNLYAPSLKIEYDAETVNLETGKVILSLDISAKTYSDLDLVSLKNNLRGKSLLETKIFLENQPAITKTKIEFWPFWVRKVPQDIDKIELQLRVD